MLKHPLWGHFRCLVLKCVESFFAGREIYLEVYMAYFSVQIGLLRIELAITQIKRVLSK